MWLKKTAIVIFLIVATVGAACAQTTEANEVEGKADLDFAKILGATPEVEVFLEKALLTMVSAAAASAEPEIADILPTLSLVQVQIFEDLFEASGKEEEKAESAKLVKTVEGILKDLEEKGWSRIVRIPEDNIHILGKMDEKVITGLAIFVVDDDELVYVNIAGSIDAESLGRTLGTLPQKYMAGELNLGALGAVLNPPGIAPLGAGLTPSGMAPPKPQPSAAEEAEEKNEDDGGQAEEPETENE